MLQHSVSGLVMLDAFTYGKDYIQKLVQKSQLWIFMVENWYESLV